MKAFPLASLLAAGLLAGCATPSYVSPVEVTRFVGNMPIQLGRGPIAVRAGAGADPGLFDQGVFQTAVAEQLGELGYVVTGGDGPQVAEVWVERMSARAEGGRSPVSVGVGGSTGSYGSGAGVGVGIDLGSLLGGGRPREVVDTQLRVVIRPSAGGTAAWEGRSRFSASSNSPYAGGREAAERVAGALFEGFPGRSGETIVVR